MAAKHIYGCPSICFRLPQTLLDELSSIAYDERLSMSELIRDALTEYLRQHQEQVKQAN